MNKYTLRTRMTENYSNILNKMTAKERDWAEKFERMQYAIERGNNALAKQIAQDLKGSPLSFEQQAAIDEERAVKERCNPAKAESSLRRKKNLRTTDNKVKSGMYDASDWLRTGGTYTDDNGNETEIGVTTNPEDALIEALDAARAKDVDLQTFLNTPALWEQPKGRGRPKKDKE